jgi:hypothetical protein
MSRTKLQELESVILRDQDPPDWRLHGMETTDANE